MEASAIESYAEYLSEHLGPANSNRISYHIKRSETTHEVDGQLPPPTVDDLNAIRGKIEESLRSKQSYVSLRVYFMYDDKGRHALLAEVDYRDDQYYDDYPT